MEVARFLLFSSLESVAAYFLMLKLFRFRPTEYLWPAVAIFLLMAAQSYLLRAEFNLSYVAPVTNLVSFTLLIALTVSVPIVWSAIISAIGFFAYAAIQTMLVATMFGSFDESMQYTSEGSTLQAASSFVAFVIVYVLHLFKFGFTAEFERLRFRGEGMLVIVLILLLITAAAFTMYNTLHVLILLIVAAGIFLYYAIMQEKRASARD